MNFAYSLIHNRSDTQPQRTECDFWDFVLQLAQPDTRGRITLEEYRSRIDDKRMQARWKVQKDGPAWIPATFAPGSKRLDSDVSAVYAVTLDFDDGVDRQTIEACLNGYRYAAHTSYSHHPEAPKWRVSIPLAHPVPPAVFAEVWHHFNQLFDGKADPSGKNPSHLYYLPAVPPGGETFYQQFAVDGEAFNPAILQPKAAAHPSGSAPAREVNSLIEKLSADTQQLLREGKPLGERSEAIFKVLLALFRAGADDATAFSVLMDTRYALSEKCRAQGEKWLRAEIKRARKKIAEKKSPDAEPQTGLDPYRGTDEANAAFFLSRHGEDVRYCPPWDKWLLWTGSHWRIDDRMDTARMAGNLPRTLYRLAGESTDSAQRGTIAALARALENRRKQNDLIATARCRVVVHHSDLDKGRFLLNATNGTIDLEIGELREHRRADLIVHDIEIHYSPDAKAPTWERFLNDVFAGDKALIQFVQRVIGYSLTGDVREQILLICYGSGSNGKSVFLNIVRKLLGKLALQAAPDLLMADRNRRHPTEQADLFGKRLVVCQETAEGRRFNESLVKQLTGGDAITARRMNEDFWTFDPTHKLWLATNHRPEIRGTDYAIWRRIRLIPFNVQFTDDGENRKDPDMEAKLTAELPGILAWAVRGCLEWKREGLRAPEAVTTATEGYRAEMDVLAAWIADCCIVKRLADAKASDLYHSYVEWCEQSGERPESQRSWGMRLSERGFKRERRMIGFFWIGIGLLSSDPYEPNEPNEPEMAIKPAQLVREGFRAKPGSYGSYGSCPPSESAKAKDGEALTSGTGCSIASNPKDDGKVRI